MNLQPETLRGHSGPVYALASDNRYLYSSAGDRIIARWNTDEKTTDAFSIKLDSPAYTICCFGNVLFAGCTNGAVIAINTESKQLLWESNYLGFAIFSVLWSESLNALLVGDAEGNLVAFSDAGKRLWHFPLASGKIRALAVADSCFYVGAQDGCLRCFDNLTLNELWSKEVHEGSIYTILRTPEGLFTGGMDGHVSHLSYMGEKLAALPIHYQSVYGLVALGEYRVSCSKDKTIKIWDENWSCVQRIESTQGHKRSINAIIVHNNRLVTAGDDKLILLWS